MIQIHDSKKKGDYSVRVVRSNGYCVADNHGFSSIKAVNANVVALAKDLRTEGITDWKYKDISTLVMILGVRDHTKGQHWAKKYGCKSGLKKLSRSSK